MASSMQVSIEVAGIDSAMVVFEPKVNKQLNHQVHILRDMIIRAQPSWLIDVVAAYHSLMIVYDIQTTDFDRVEQWLKNQLNQLQQHKVDGLQANVHEFFVCFDDEFALDMERVCEHSGLNSSEVIERYSTETYHVYTIGFAPGFAYLGDVPEPLQVPRVDTPRTKVPAGSVAIANQQTAIYPRTSPGGWNIIGRVAGWRAQSGLQLRAGDQIRFIAVSKQRFIEIEAKADASFEGAAGFAERQS